MGSVRLTQLGFPLKVQQPIEMARFPSPVSPNGGWGTSTHTGDDVRWWAICKTAFIRALHPLWKEQRGTGWGQLLEESDSVSTRPHSKDPDSPASPRAHTHTAGKELLSVENPPSDRTHHFLTC